MERLKALEELHQPDSRWPIRVIGNRGTDGQRRYRLEDHYAQVVTTHLPDHIPEDVRNSFITAQHLAIYAWFAYALVPVAMLQAASTLELALKSRMGGENAPGLHHRLNHALANGWIDSGRLFDHMEPYLISGPPVLDGVTAGTREVTREAYAVTVVKSLVATRNGLAHGVDGLIPHPYYDLRLVSSMIEQLFEP